MPPQLLHFLHTQGDTRPSLLLPAPKGCPHPSSHVAQRPRDTSDGGFIRGLLHELGGEEGVGHGVRAPRGWDHQADFLVGPSPLRVQLAVVAERNLAGDNTSVWLPNPCHKCQSP